jgi:hypothetical protein
MLFQLMHRLPSVAVRGLPWEEEDSHRHHPVRQREPRDMLCYNITYIGDQ